MLLLWQLLEVKATDDFIATASGDNVVTCSHHLLHYTQSEDVLGEVMKRIQMPTNVFKQINQPKKSQIIKPFT